MSLRTLTAAPPKSPAPTQRFIVSDAAALQPLLRPLGQRMGLIQVRTEREWQQLRCAVPQIGCCPELKRGIVVGLATSTGTPLDPTWPFVWERIRLHEGAGLLEAHFHPGNYLADDTMYLETAYVQDLVAVLVVSLDGVQYYPE